MSEDNNKDDDQKLGERDHRRLGKELDLYTMSDLVGPGLPLFTPKGTLMRKLIIDKINSLQEELGYQAVTTPHLTKQGLYETSGHWDKFGDELFKVKGMSDEFILKPMNCPHHTQIYSSRPRSYRELPIRFSELGVVYRDEQAGELLGLSRTRSISMDDGHIFCTKEQMKQEIDNIITIMEDFYNALGMFDKDTVWVSLSTRDSENKDKYLGDDDVWESSEAVLKEIAEERKLNYKVVEGEGAFYGPKLDFMFEDSLGRERQLATVQLDFNQPKRFGLEYIDSDGSKKTPIMIHRAIAGSLERFMAVMIEHFAGAFPVWLSPVQVKVLPITEAHKDYAYKVGEELKAAGIRFEIDDSDESLGKKIRNAKKEKAPFIAVIGDKEVEAKTMNVECRTDGDLGAKSVEELAAIING